MGFIMLNVENEVRQIEAVGVRLIKVIGNRGILEIIAIFSIVLFTGILVAVAAVRTSSTSIIYNTLADPRFIDFSYFLDATLVLVIALLVLRRHGHHSNTLLFEVLEGMVTPLTSFFAFLLIFAILLPQSVASGMIYVYSTAIALALLLLKDRYHRLRDLTTIVSSIGVGLILGFNFPFSYALFILAAIAIYDYVGVFKTREMVSLAGAFSYCNLSFLISVSDLEAVPKWGLSDKEIGSYMDYLSRMHDLQDPSFCRILRSGKLPVISQISLGEGDLSLPLMAAVSAYVSFSGTLAAVVVLGSIIGMVATMLILKVYKRPIPAIPPLFSFIGIFAGSYMLATGINFGFHYLGVLLVIVSALAMLIDLVTITRRMHSKGTHVMHV